MCCDVVIALWIEHGDGMRKVRVEDGGDSYDQVECWRREGKGQKSSRVAQRSRPGYARETQPILMRGKVRYFPRAMWGTEAKFEMERTLVEEKLVGNEDEAEVEFGDDLGEMGGEQTRWSKMVGVTKMQNEVTTLR